MPDTKEEKKRNISRIAVAVADLILNTEKHD